MNIYLSQTGQGDFEDEKVDIVFNRNILINESEAIDNCSKSQGIISNETIVAQHPWVTDVQAELKKMKKQDETEYSINLEGIKAKAGDSIDEE